MPTPDEREEVATKVRHLVRDKYDGDFAKAFRHYDANDNGNISKDELMQICWDAGIGNIFTRSSWADGIIKALDKDDDERISLEELQKVVGLQE